MQYRMGHGLPVLQHRIAALCPPDGHGGGVAGLTALFSLVPLLCSSDASYAKRTDGVLDTLEQENTDSTGAFCLGVMSEQHRYNGSEEAVSRVFFYASDTLLSDVFLKTPNLMNRSYASSLLSFLYKQEDTMVFEPKTMESALLVMTGDTATLIFWLLVVALPCATLLTGLVVWARRRYL